MTWRFFASVCSFVSLLSHLGCSDDEPERPPTGSSPGAPPPVAGGGAGPTNSDDEEPEDPEPEPEPNDEIRASFRVYRDDFFADWETYSERSDVHFWGESRQEIQTIEFDGVFFSTDLVRNQPDVWVMVEPEFDERVYPTLGSYDTTQDEVDLFLVPRSAVEFILSGLSTPTFPVDAAAQLLVRVLDAGGRPLRGVTAAPTRGVDVVYFDGGVWTEFASETDSTGQFFVYNLPARSLPGQTLLVILDGSARGQFDVQIAAGAFTLATLTVE